jgi:hypothetical protein
MDIPRWVVDCIVVVVILWVADREVTKLKRWVEDLVGFKRPKNTADAAALAGNCEACGKPKARDYAECPTCNRRFVESGVCGTKWTEAARRSRGLEG